jgi:hypothetical protein
MIKNTFFKISGLVVASVMAVLLVAVPASASGFEYEYMLKIMQRSFVEKSRIAELVRVKYPELAGDVLNIIEAKYSTLPQKMPQIVNSCFKNGAKDKLKLIRAAVKEFRAGYDGSISAFIKEFAETVLKANPNLVDDLLAKRSELKSLAPKHESVIKTLADSKEEIKKIMQTRQAAVRDEIKSSAMANFNKFSAADVKKAAAELKAFKDDNPQIIERAEASGKKYPEMKKPALIFVSLLKEPDAMVKLAGIVDDNLKNEIYAFIDGFLETLIKDGKADYFGARAEIADLLDRKNPGVLFKAAKFKLEVKREMGAFIAEKYPALPAKVSSLLDKHFGGISGKILDTINKEQPELVKGVIARLRSEFGGLENDINALLAEKYPSLLSDIENGVQK